MKVYRDKTMSDQTFELDDCVFYDCFVKNCDMFYSGGDVDFLNLRMEGCRFHFRGAAKNTHQLLEVLGMLSESPQVSQLGTISTVKLD